MAFSKREILEEFAEASENGKRWHPSFNIDSSSRIIRTSINYTLVPKVIQPYSFFLIIERRKTKKRRFYSISPNESIVHVY